eukprot:NODE_458_length_8223_cov_0.302683.p7 type:complete len:135 gc:universal NODE_458_length_8223_cov_0.302683:2315-2719(+)
MKLFFNILAAVLAAPVSEIANTTEKANFRSANNLPKAEISKDLAPNPSFLIASTQLQEYASKTAADKHPNTESLFSTVSKQFAPSQTALTEPTSTITIISTEISVEETHAETEYVFEFEDEYDDELIDAPFLYE